MEQRIGAYRIEREVARGGMGVVFRASAPDGRPVAIKVLSAGRAASAAQRERFLREARALTRLRHEQVVGLLDAGEQGGCPWLALEWVEGESLEARLEREGPLDPRDAAELVRRLALALEHCHAQGVLHRDLKPGNVLLRRADGQPLLTDFGLARDLEASLDGEDPLSRTGCFLGTPGYWAPEQARGERERVGPASDVFGLGALLFALLTGQPPLELGEHVGAAVLAASRPAPAPSALRPGVPPELDRICARALAAEPGARHASARDLALELERFLNGAARQVPDRPRRGRASLLLGLLAGAALVGGLALRARLQRQAGERLLRDSQAAARVGDWERGLALADEALVRGHPSQRAAAHLARAHVRFAQRQRAAVQAELEQARALSADPGLAALAEGMQGLFARAWDPTATLAALERAVALRPDDPEAWLLRGAARERAGEHARALEDFDRALALDPGHALALAHRGATRIGLQDLAGAEADLSRAVELAPLLGLARHDRGNARRSRGDLAGALADYDRALELLPRADLHLTRGTLRQEQGDLAGAEADFTRAILLAPYAPQAWTLRGVLRRLRGERAAGMADLDRGVELAPRGTQALLERANARNEDDELEGALADYERLLEVDPGCAQAWNGRAVARRKQGDQPGAEADVRRALELDPGYAEAHANLGATLAGRREYAAALESLQRALDALPPEGPKAAQVREYMALVRAAQGQAR